MHEKALVVFTAKGRERLLSEGGTSEWSLNPDSMRHVRYVVCTRNTDPSKRSESGNDGIEPRGAAFLVGRVAGLVEKGISRGRKRYLVAFNETAEVLVEGIWDGARVPTRYVDLADLATRGLDIANLNFRPLEGPASTFDPPTSSSTSSYATELTIPQALDGLSIGLGVPRKCIEIIVRG